MKQQIQSLRKSLTKDFKTLNTVYVSRTAILNNFDLLQSIQDKQVIPVLKANAYGHGLFEVSEILKERTFPYIAVDAYFEALEIRKTSDQPILILGAINPDNFKNMSFKNLALVLFDANSIKLLGETGKKVKIHLEIDTGMRRHGVRPEDLEELLHQLTEYDNIELDGVMTHLSDADNPDDNEYTKQQIKDFDQSVELIIGKGFEPKFIHAGQSAGSTRDESKHTNTIRPGLSLYGLSPLEANDSNKEILNKLKPALRLTSRVGAVQNLKQGDSVSYNRLFKASEDMQIAVMPLGYYEALPRRLSAQKVFFGKDSNMGLTGRICMNHTMLDNSETQLMLGDEVEYYSNEPASDHSIQAIANKLEYTNTYELLIAINQNIRRVIT